jgi:hypothetical protein
MKEGEREKGKERRLDICRGKCYGAFMKWASKYNRHVPSFFFDWSSVDNEQRTIR